MDQTVREVIAAVVKDELVPVVMDAIKFAFWRGFWEGAITGALVTFSVLAYFYVMFIKPKA
jgi:hypothetical protein